MNNQSVAGFSLPQISVLTGGMMGTLGIAFFAATDYVTALFPLVFGVVIAGFGAMAISNPKSGSKAMQISFFASAVSVMVGLSTALSGSWVTTTSLIEQVMMTLIGAGHLASGYAAQLQVQATKKESGTSELALGEINPVKELVTAAESSPAPEEKIIPATVFALVTD